MQQCSNQSAACRILTCEQLPLLLPPNNYDDSRFNLAGIIHALIYNKWGGGI